MTHTCSSFNICYKSYFVFITITAYVKVELFHLQAQTVRDGFNGEFSGTIRRTAISGHSAQHGSDVHDTSVSLSNQRKEPFGHANNTKQVDGSHLESKGTI